MNSSRILCCDSCQKEKADILCVSCTSQKLKEIRFQNEYRYKEINGTSLECPRNSMTESLLTLQISSKTQSTRNVNELSKLNAENNTLKSILKKIQDRKKALQEHVTNLKEHNSKNEQKLQVSRNQDKEAQESNKELMKSKLRCFRNIYNIHHAFPKLQVPLRLRIVQDKFFEATQSGIIESQHFSLDMSRFATLKGMNAKHAKLISEVLTRIAEFVIYISEVLFVNLPVKMQKSEGLYWLSFHNDPSKVYQLHFDENVHEGNFFQAISLLFTNFLYLSRMINVKLKIPINLESSSENDILNLNPLLNKLTEDNDGFQGKQEELENSEIPLDIINLGKRSNSLENEFEIIEDTDSV